MDFEVNAVFERVPEGYIAYVEEIPGAHTQGATLDEARENLKEAVRLIIEANRELGVSAEGGEPPDVLRERLRIPAL